MNINKKIIKIFLIGLVMNTAIAQGVEPKAEPKTEVKKSDRQKVLAFDDPSMVEGVNKQPFDSLSQLGKGRKNKRTRLYQKRTHFPVENIELISELAVSP